METTNRTTGSQEELVEPKLKPEYNHMRETLQEQFICPISHEIMIDPVVAPDGHTYERVQIEAWFASHSTSPSTNARLESKSLVPNHALRKTIGVFYDLPTISRRQSQQTTSYSGGAPVGTESFHDAAPGAIQQYPITGHNNSGLITSLIPHPPSYIGTMQRHPITAESTSPMFTSTAVSTSHMFTSLNRYHQPPNPPPSTAVMHSPSTTVMHSPSTTVMHFFGDEEDNYGQPAPSYTTISSDDLRIFEQRSESPPVYRE